MWLYYFLVSYILICAILIFSIAKTYKAKFLYIVLTMGLFAFLVMFKSEHVGNDTAVYIRLFNSISDSKDISIFTWRFETGYLYLNKILSYISDHHQILFIVTGLYVYVIFGRFIYKHSKIVWLSVFLFFTFCRFFDLSLSGIRQIFALATLALSYEYIIKKKLFKFALTVLLATLFHNMALVFLAAYPLSKLKLTKNLVLFVLISSVVVYTTFSPILNLLLDIFPRYRYYLGGTYLDGEMRISIILSLTINVFILTVSEIFNHRFTYSSQGRKVISYKTYEDNIQSIFILIVCATLIISFRGPILKRFENIFVFFTIIYYPNAIAKIKDSTMKMLMIYATVVLFSIYSIIIYIYRPEWQSTYPYTFFWN
jgi:hypothetical protein